MIRLDDLSPLIKETFNDHILTMLESFTKKNPIHGIYIETKLALIRFYSIFTSSTITHTPIILNPCFNISSRRLTDQTE